MNACNIRVITNGYIVGYMDGTEFVELCFNEREEFLGFLTDNVDAAKREEGE